MVSLAMYAFVAKADSNETPGAGELHWDWHALGRRARNRHYPIFAGAPARIAWRMDMTRAQRP
jgi:hypothetical protein